MGISPILPSVLTLALWLSVISIIRVLTNSV